MKYLKILKRDAIKSRAEGVVDSINDTKHNVVEGWRNRKSDSDTNE